MALSGRESSYLGGMIGYNATDMKFTHLYRFETRVGWVYIGQAADGHFHPIVNGEPLGGHVQAWQAAEDLALGHTCTPSCGTDTSKLGIPRSLDDWERVW